MAERIIAFRSPYNEKVYAEDDPVLVGMGNPPSCPDFCRENPGRGHMPMRTIMVERAGDGTMTEL